MRLVSVVAACVLGTCVWATSSTTTRGERQVVFHNNYPSLLYINSAAGSASVDTRADGDSNIVHVILYPANGEAQAAKRAVVVLQGSATGTLVLTQDTPPVGPTRIEGTITNLTAGLHGFHIHEFGDLSGGCGTAGGHFNPYKKEHGSPENLNRHVGDLGNILADESGLAYVNITDQLVTLVGPTSAVGRAIVVHAGQDDLGKGGNPESLKTGNAGGRVACGVIGLA
ncbi:superoxide dismutase [Cu-Zn] [Procambarus clarkii]|uniref:superoxide dismutase [Cu-Zn] n=1 Tax=Procambarus clarkii TaxID=6728 RepID=UPI001E673F36|nr:superoxide dismutase [Cu-Zn]-like [Procambarus clarkii]